MKTKSPNVMPSMRDWYARAFPPPPPPAPKPPKAKPTRTPATDDERAALAAIFNDVTFPVAIASKRFAREMRNAVELTDGQRDFLWSIVWRFRRQVRDKRLVKVAEEKKARVA